MKHTLLVSMIFWAITATAKQNSEPLKIQSATVYISGAQILSTTQTNLIQGENEVVLTNVATDVNDQSLMVNATNGVTILSAEVKKNYLIQDSLTPTAQALKDSVEIVMAERKQLGEKINTCKLQIAIIDSNKKVSGTNNGLSVAELQKLLDLVGSKYEGILHQKNVLETHWAKVDEHLNRLQKQLAVERKNGNQDVSMIVLKLKADKPCSSTVLVSYYVQNAGWSPVYDFSADDLTKPASLVYKANIHQSTGITWDHLRLKLSTDNPREGIQAPVLTPWFLAFNQPVVRSYTKNLVNQGDHLMAAAMAPGAYAQQNSEINMGGARAEGNLYVIDGVQVQPNGTLENAVSVDNSGNNMIFDIDIPYTIAAEGHNQLVSIKEFQMPAIFRYYAAPKLDKDVFLEARISNWEDLGLLPGPCNTFFEGTYVGQSYLNFANTRDTLDVSLGRDKHVLVHREKDKSFRSVRTIGNNVSESVAYSIEVKNSRKNRIDLVLEDQVPVSTDKDIMVTDLETGNSTFDAEKGKLRWQLSLNPNDSKNLKFSYTVKYPKSKKINN